MSELRPNSVTKRFQRSVTPNVRRRSSEKSAKQIQREHADYQKVIADLGKISVDRVAMGFPARSSCPRYGAGTGPRAQHDQ